MAWEKHSEYIDEAQGMHVTVLRSGKREHQVMIQLGHDACPTCGHVVAKDNVGEIDPQTHVAGALSELQRSSDAIHDYARKHRVPLK